MDPLSIIVALCTLCDAAYKITKSIRKTSKMIKCASNDVEKLAKDIELFMIVLGAAHTAIEPHRNSDLRETRVLSYLSRVKGFDHLIKQSKDVTDEMDRYMRKIRDLRGKHQFIVGYKWKVQKKEIDDTLRPAMACVTCNLQIVMTSLCLEAALKQPPSAATARKIKCLKQEIKFHLRTITCLQEQLASRTGNLPQETHRSQSSLDINIQDAFLDLAESLLDHEAVPDFPSLSSFSSSSIRTMSTQNFVQPQHSRSRSRPHSIISKSSRATQRSSATSLEPDNHFVETNVSQVSSRHRSNQSLSNSIPPIRSLQPQRPPVSSQSRTMVDVPIPPSPDTTSEGDTAPNHEIKTTSSVLAGPSTQEDFIGTYSSSYLLHLNPRHNFTAESGYINTPTGPISATALVDNDFEGNFISQAYAVRLGLTIKELEDDEEGSNESWIYFGDGQRERKVGTVALKWRDGLMPDGKSFPVHCWVCVHDIRNLVFGRRFVEKRNHYRNGNGKSGGAT